MFQDGRMNPIAVKITVSKPAYEGETEALSKLEQYRNHPQKGLSSTIQTLSDTPAFLPSRRITAHQFKYIPRNGKPNREARLQRSGRRNKPEVSSKEPLINLLWIVIHPLPHNGFRYSFTLSPKCFSSFAHATCALSVFP